MAPLAHYGKPQSRKGTISLPEWEGGSAVMKVRNKPPNGLRISCRERAAEHLQNATDLAREAVNCMPLLARKHGDAAFQSDSFCAIALQAVGVLTVTFCQFPFPRFVERVLID
jgi:hypothetical protein